MRKLFFMFLMTQMVGIHVFAMRTSKNDLGGTGGDEKNDPPKFLSPRKESTPRTPRNSAPDNDCANYRRSASGQITIGEILDEDSSDNEEPIVKPVEFSAGKSPEVKRSVMAGWNLKFFKKTPSKSAPVRLEEERASPMHTACSFEPNADLYFELKRLFEMELHETFRRGLCTEVFRGETPVTIFVSKLLNTPGAMVEFRVNFVRFAISQIKVNYEIGNPASLAVVLVECMDYLMALPSEKFPIEIVLILKSLRDITTPENSSSPVSVLLGSLFFLRFICPALAQPNTYCGLLVQNTVNDALRNLAKALQLISNEVDPDEEHLFYPIVHDLRALHQRNKEFLSRIADLPMRLEGENQADTGNDHDELDPGVLTPGIFAPSANLDPFFGGSQ